MQHDLLSLWHLSSLDAPTVATLWTCFVARATHVSLAPEFPVAMFLAVWILYAVDRVLDARSASGIEARHRFHGAHRIGFLAVAGAGLVVLPALVAAARLPVRTFHLYLGLGVGLGVWFAAVHRRPGRTLPKEMTTGAFFGAAIFVPFMTRVTTVPAILFAGLCMLNCLYIHSWENGAGVATHATTEWARRFLPQLSLALVLFPLVHLGPISLAISVSAALLLVLNRFHTVFESVTLRAAADLALLTPLLVCPFLR